MTKDRGKGQGARGKIHKESLFPIHGPLTFLYKYIATLGFIGYIPVAPGTFGTLAGFFLIMLLKPDDMVLLIATLTLFIIGAYTSDHAEKLLGKDSSHIVIDELCGYFISVLLVPKSVGYLVAAFILFRFFDILKPPPVRNAESSFSGGAGVMLDDVMAGIYTNICLQAWRYLV
ncbi:MAG: phosphatidylglycerophosphatase A [Nitrospiraceae bacterium]|nr:MAG: phosphatidylglycerophosphatase A [Nitrospiraceae bacterium]